MTNRAMSWVGRALLTVILFGVAVLTVSVPIGVLGSSNLVWGEDDQYGRVDIPGSAVLHLPAGSIMVNVAVHIVGRGNGTPDLPFPSDLALTLTPVGDAGQPTVTQVHEFSSNADDNLVNTQRQAWTVHVPRDGSYQVTVKGSFLGIGINPQLWFGHGPPIPGKLVPAIAAGVVVVAFIFWFFILPGLRRRRRPAPAGPAVGLTTWRRAPTSTTEPSPEPRPTREPSERAWMRARGFRFDPKTEAPDPVDQLAKLADLHDRGALTDAEFATEKAKIIGRY